MTEEETVTLFLRIQFFHCLMDMSQSGLGGLMRRNKFEPELRKKILDFHFAWNRRFPRADGHSRMNFRQSLCHADQLVEQHGPLMWQDFDKTVEGVRDMMMALQGERRRQESYAERGLTLRERVAAENDYKRSVGIPIRPLQHPFRARKLLTDDQMKEGFGGKKGEGT